MNGMFGTLFKIVAASGITYVVVIKVLGVVPFGEHRRIGRIPDQRGAL